MNSITIALLLSVLFTITSSCGVGIFPMSSGGCCSPPPPMCGCAGGGRKKRSLPEKPAKPQFFGIASNDEDVLCNHPELKKIMVENMHPNVVDSSKALQSALESHKLQRYVVVCSEKPFVYTVRADTVYCGARKNYHYCHAFVL